VVGLHREQIGDIVLDADLAPGEFRALTEEEIRSL
jgi:16S rRNA pseudouridine516 synthase